MIKHGCRVTDRFRHIATLEWQGTGWPAFELSDEATQYPGSIAIVVGASQFASYTSNRGF